MKNVHCFAISETIKFEMNNLVRKVKLWWASKNWKKCFQCYYLWCNICALWKSKH